MKFLAILPFLLFSFLPSGNSQCKIALDLVDEFDSTRLVATKPMDIGFIIPTGALAEDLEGKTYAQEARAIFSYGDDMDKVRSFFLTLPVLERKFFMIDNGFNVILKFTDGQLVELFNAPEPGEFDRDMIMWKYVHTCVVPLEIFYKMKDVQVEKIRINYNTYKRTIALEEPQQIALKNAVNCVDEHLKTSANPIKP